MPKTKNQIPWAKYGRSKAAGLKFRLINQRDMGFLADLYASTRAEEIASTGWGEKQTQQFLQQQFDAQHTHYQKQYPDADWLVILKERERIGRLYLERWPSQHRLIDIALVTEMRGKGLGAALILDLMDEAKSAGKALSLHVEKFNPAKDLYLRMGFETLADKGVYDLMAWPKGSEIK